LPAHFRENEPDGDDDHRKAEGEKYDLHEKIIAPVKLLRIPLAYGLAPSAKKHLDQDRRVPERPQ
jgi:hypothetical protein